MLFFQLRCGEALGRIPDGNKAADDELKAENAKVCDKLSFLVLLVSDKYIDSEIVVQL